MDCKPYLKAHARKLDLYLYEHLFEGSSPEPVINELASYQHPDGGFGHALEADLRLPTSSVIATTVAFQYLAQLDAGAHELTDGAIRYLLRAYDKTSGGWVNVPPTANDFPRAPWWNYEDVLSWAGWGNPSAEVLGYLLQYAEQVDGELLSKLSARAISRLHEIDDPEQHEVKCYIRLYKQADKTLQAQLHNPLAKHIQQAAKTDPKDWQGYAAAPLTFVDSPDAPFADLFDKQLLLENAQYIRRQIVSASHWEPAWSWGQFDADWAVAKQDWSGKLTVDNLKLLRAFGITE